MSDDIPTESLGDWQSKIQHPAYFNIRRRLNQQELIEYQGKIDAMLKHRK